MKTFVFAIIYLPFFGSITACSSITKFGYGAKKIEVQDYKSTADWLTKYKFNTGQMITVAPEKYIEFFMMYHRKTILFDKEGQHIADGSCTANFAELIGKLESGMDVKLKTSGPDFDTFFSNVKSILGEDIDFKEYLPKHDYALIIPYALALGNKLQVKDIREIYKAAIQNPNASIHIYFLNFDKQEWWGSEWIAKNHIKFN